MPDATYGTADSLTLTLKGNGDTGNRKRQGNRDKYADDLG